MILFIYKGKTDYTKKSKIYLKQEWKIQNRNLIKKGYLCMMKMKIKMMG